MAGKYVLADAGSNYLIRFLDTSRKLMNFSGKKGVVFERQKDRLWVAGALRDPNFGHLSLFIGERPIYTKPLHS
jgi:hypothetical protein